MVCNLIEHLALNQSEHDKSLPDMVKSIFHYQWQKMSQECTCTLQIRQSAVIISGMQKFFQISTPKLERHFSQINGLSVAF